MITDKPGPPGLPEITDFDENMVKLRWDPPIRDGGAAITGYVIEKKAKNSTVSSLLYVQYITQSWKLSLLVFIKFCRIK